MKLGRRNNHGHELQEVSVHNALRLQVYNTVDLHHCPHQQIVFRCYTRSTCHSACCKDPELTTVARTWQTCQCKEARTTVVSKNPTPDFDYIMYSAKTPSEDRRRSMRLVATFRSLVGFLWPQLYKLQRTILKTVADCSQNCHLGLLLRAAETLRQWKGTQVQLGHCQVYLF
eukprot:scpid97581/ scgid20730/ 